MPFVPFSRAKGGAQPGGGTMQQMPALQSMPAQMSMQEMPAVQSMQLHKGHCTEARGPQQPKQVLTLEPSIKAK